MRRYSLRCDFFIILTPGLNFDAICLCFNAVLAIGHLQRQIAWKNLNNALVAFSSFSAQQLPSLTIHFLLPKEERMVLTNYQSMQVCKFNDWIIRKCKWRCKLFIIYISFIVALTYNFMILKMVDRLERCMAVWTGFWHLWCVLFHVFLINI